MLLGIFAVSVLHDIVRLLFGVVGLALARNARSARVSLMGLVVALGRSTRRMIDDPAVERR